LFLFVSANIQISFNLQNNLGKIFLQIFSAPLVCLAAPAIFVDDLVGVFAGQDQLDCVVFGSGAEVALRDVQDAVLASPAAAELEVFVGSVVLCHFIVILGDSTGL
jgi:hypothetical protein